MTKKQKMNIKNPIVKYHHYLILAIFLLSFCQLLPQGTPGLAYNLINNGTAYAVSQGTANASHIEIPETYNELPVSAIAYQGFQDFTIMTTISIPNTVTSIYHEAFMNCSSLSAIIIPEGVTGIGNSAFRGCSSLLSVNIPSNVIVIGSYAFYGCASLTSIYIPNNNTEIGMSAFSNCSNLTSINIPSNISIIHSGTFFGCTSLTTITIPNSVTQISSSAFERCTSLISIIIPSSVTYIEGRAFGYCISLTTINIPNSVTSIHGNPFTYCSNLETISVSPGNIYFRSEGNCLIQNSNDQLVSGTKNSIIPNNVTSIIALGFAGISSLYSLSIPNNVINIGGLAFVDCTNLSSINIPNDINIIYQETFKGCSNLTSIYIPNNVTQMGGSVFVDCSSLTIYAEASSQPPEWYSWNPDNRPVFWESPNIQLPPRDLSNIVLGNNVILDWINPLYIVSPFQGFIIYHDNTQLFPNPIMSSTYTIENIPIGSHNFNVVAVYTGGESDPISTTATILAPSIAITAPNNTLDFGEVAINTEVEQEIGIMNILGGVLVVNNITFAAGSNPAFSLALPELPINLLGGESEGFTVKYQPTSIGTHSAVIMINNNTDEPVVLLQVTGTSIVVSIEDEAGIVTQTVLKGNYPNPFNPETTIHFALNIASNLRIVIYNSKGQLVKSLINREYPAGNHEIIWNGKDDNGREVGSGVYFYKMQTDENVGVKRMMMIK